MRHLVTIVSLFILTLGIHLYCRPTVVHVVGSLSIPAQRALTARQIPWEFDGLITTIEVTDRRAAVSALAQALKTHQKYMDVISHNIANAETTRTADGTPYRRQTVTLAPDGSVGEVKEDEFGYTWVYDPSHPDAFREGSKTGYRAKPNVNLVQEMTGMMLAQRDYNLDVSVIEKLDPNFIVPTQISFCEDLESINLNPEMSALGKRDPDSIVPRIGFHDDFEHFDFQSCLDETQSL